MPAKLAIRIFMNSSMEAVLNFKTACSFKLFDQNLEIHVENCGTDSIAINSCIDLEGEKGLIARIDNLFPPGNHLLSPKEIKAFYGQLDEKVWTSSRRLVIYDTDNNSYTCPICHDSN
jgi:hypothetical protein